MDFSLQSPVIDFLLTRCSTPISAIGLPAPTDEEIETMIRIASRVPDHGRLAPWRFILYRGKAREAIGEALVSLAEERQGSMNDSQKDKERTRFSRAPLVIGVVFRPVEHHIPQWEQFLSAGAAAMNLLHAATGMGYAANWISNWYADDEKGRALLGLAPHERVAGFVHIGSSQTKVPERPRPDVKDLISDYTGPWKG